MKEAKTEREFMIQTVDNSEAGPTIIGLKDPKKFEKFTEKCYNRIIDKDKISYSLTIRSEGSSFKFAMAKCPKLEGFDFVLIAPAEEEIVRFFGYIESNEWFDKTIELVHILSGSLDLKYGLTEAAKLEPESIELFKKICAKYVPPENYGHTQNIFNTLETKN